MELFKAKVGSNMNFFKTLALLMLTTVGLAACGEPTQQGQSSASSEVASSAAESTPSTEGSEAVSSEEPEATASSAGESETQLNEDEAAMIARAMTTISELTGYTEAAGFMYIVHPIEGKIVTIEVRENGEETASMMGMYKYNDETKAVQELDMITGEYVDYPAE